MWVVGLAICLAGAVVPQAVGRDEAKPRGPGDPDQSRQLLASVNTTSRGVATIDPNHHRPNEGAPGDDLGLIPFVHFHVVSGPNAGLEFGTAAVNHLASWTYSSDKAGTDTLEAYFERPLRPGQRLLELPGHQLDRRSLAAASAASPDQAAHGAAAAEP
jgi:hypothetical protein